MVWTRVGAKIEEALDSISFEDLLQQAQRREPGLSLKPKKRLVMAGKGGC